MSANPTSLHMNPFAVLQVCTRDNSRRVVEAAEERSLLLDHELCQKARFDLTNPRQRISAELAWLPGVAPRVVQNLLRGLEANPVEARHESGVPELARANLMAAALEIISESEPAGTVADVIREFCLVVENIAPDLVMRDINEDRAIASIPEIRSLEAVEAGLGERRAFYRSVLKAVLDRMEPNKLVQIMTDVVEEATEGGEVYGSALLNALVDSYEIETRGFLEKEYDNIAILMNSVRDVAPKGEAAVSPILDRLERVARNWDRVAQPIQICAKSRGTIHRQSRDLAYELRNLGIALNNEHDLLQQAHRVTELLRDIFAEVPDVAERLEEDAEALADLREKAAQREQDEAEWERSITFKTQVGLLFSDVLAISSDGIIWQNKRFPLDSITCVRWGGVRRSVNGIPTGTSYTIGFCDADSEHAISLRDKDAFSGFVEALWRAVCVRLMIEFLQALSQGKAIAFGDISIEDAAVTLTRHKFFGNERIRVGWHDVHVWSADGNFFIGKKNDQKIYSSASYIEVYNTHVLEHVIRSGFKIGVSRLSDYLRR